MTAPNEPMDGGAMDPRIARAFINYREGIAQATERVIRDLRAAGVPDAAITAALTKTPGAKLPG